MQGPKPDIAAGSFEILAGGHGHCADTILSSLTSRLAPIDSTDSYSRISLSRHLVSTGSPEGYLAEAAMSRIDASFTAFMASRRPDLRRIAARTCGEHTVEDVCSEAWLIAREIAQKRGIAVDFSNQDDQETILSWLYVKLVRYADKSVRYAVKLDRDWDAEGAEAATDALARLLTAPEQFDPLIRMLDEEARSHPLDLIRHSYSQASAYIVLLHRFDWDLETLAEHLRILAATLRRKVRASGISMKCQPSLFDRITTVDLDFIPRIARRRVASTSFPSNQTQVTWSTSDWTCVHGM